MTVLRESDRLRPRLSLQRLENLDLDEAALLRAILRNEHGLGIDDPGAHHEIHFHHAQMKALGSHDDVREGVRAREQDDERHQTHESRPTSNSEGKCEPTRQSRQLARVIGMDHANQRPGGL